MSVCAVVGGQFGSEGKGLIATHLGGEYSLHVRVGAANAGHTFIAQGEKILTQQLPCAAYAHPDAGLALGPGALLSGQILQRELTRCREFRVRHRLPPLQLYVDHRAHLIQPVHIKREAEGDLGERIGSTSARAGEGIGEAQAARVLRATSARRVCQGDLPEGAQLVDVAELIYLSRAEGVLLEGTQGTSLSLTTGEWPYVTSRETSASGLAADCGVGPRELDRIVMVCRAHPIRVAGNSGNFWPDSRELSWEQLGLPEERTSVTRLPRRVALFSPAQVEYNARLNSATELALTFADYLDPELHGRTRALIQAERDSSRSGLLIDLIEALTGLPLTMIGTGPGSVARVDPISRPESAAWQAQLRERALEAGLISPAPELSPGE